MVRPGAIGKAAHRTQWVDARPAEAL